MRELINFTLNSPQGANSHTVVFKQPLLIKPNSTITVNSAVISWNPLTGYLEDDFIILTDFLKYLLRIFNNLALTLPCTGFSFTQTSKPHSLFLISSLDEFVWIFTLICILLIIDSS